MKKVFLCFGVMCISPGESQQLAAQERYQATWESLKKYTTPDKINLKK